MDEWRPEGWENPYEFDGFRMEMNVLTALDQRHMHRAYEEGANALLKMLRGRGERRCGHPCDNGLIPCCVCPDADRTKVYIPDDTKGE